MYYYAYIENGICIDIERTRTQRTDLTDYVEVTENEYYAYMDEDTTSPYYIIGMSWNGSAWVVPAVFYYAILNEKDIAVRVVYNQTEINRTNFIPITEDEYNSKSCINRQWDAVTEQFITVPLSVYADADTRTISVNGSEVPLQTLLNAMQAEIDAKGGNVTATDILIALTTVDGAGSGVDSDTLDGFDSTHFAKDNEVQAMKLAMNNKAESSEVQTLKLAMNNKAESSEVQTIAAKMETMASEDDLAVLATKSDWANMKAEILSAVLSGTGSVKSVQRGVIGQTDNFKTITLNAIDPNKSIVLVNGSIRCDSGEYAYSLLPYVSSLTATTLTLSPGAWSSNGQVMPVSWQVIEFY